MFNQHYCCLGLGTACNTSYIHGIDMFHAYKGKIRYYLLGNYCCRKDKLDSQVDIQYISE